MNIRNAKHASDGSITVDYEHPKYGWIEFSARPDDVEQLGRDLYALALSSGDIAPEPEKPARQIAEEAAQAKAIADASAARADAKLSALGAMSPAQVRAYIAANVTNLADAKDVLGTLAVAVSILARRL